MDSDERILGAIGKVEEKVDTLTDKFNASDIRTAVAIAELKQAEAACPIQEVQATLRTVEGTANEAKREGRRISAIIAGGISAIGVAVAAALGWRSGS